MNERTDRPGPPPCNTRVAGRGFPIHPLFIVRSLLRRALQQYLALSADTRRFAALLLLWMLAMLASMAAGPM